jgi:phage-related protein
MVLERWGGHLVRNNWQIEVKQNIGRGRNAVLAYGKNIKDVKSLENWNNVVTKLMPVDKDDLLLPEVWLELGEVLYDIPFTKVISFDQNEITQEDFKNADGNIDESAYHDALETDLRTKGLLYLNKNCVPKVNYSLNAYLKNISDAGDKIIVKHPKCKLDLKTNVTALEYDVILERVTKVEFENFKENLKNLVSDLENKIIQEVDKSAGNTAVKLEKELTEATNKINSVLGNSYIIYDGSQILVLDKTSERRSRQCDENQCWRNRIFSNRHQRDVQQRMDNRREIDMQIVKTLNLTSDLIKGGTLK